MGYLIILIIVVFAVYYVVNDKKGKLEVFKRYNEEEKGIVNSIGDIRCFFDMRDEGEYTLDDQTWYDLNMDEVYRKIDRSYSSVGESVLYSMLRNPLTNKEEIIERGKKIEAINDDIDLRAKLKLIFFNLGYDKKNRFIEMIESEKEPSKAKYIIYNIMGKAIPIALILLSIFLQKPEFLAALAFNMWINLFIAERERKNVSAGGLIYLNRMLEAAAKVSKLKGDSIVNKEEIKNIVKELQGIASKIKLIHIFTMYGGVLEVFSVPFLTVESAYYGVINELDDKKESILKLYELLGEIEAYISIGGFKEAKEEYISKPVFKNEITINIVNGVHPLLEEPVANTIHLDKKGMVLTGSNMSGKSTFLRMVGVNIVLAQVFDLVLAETYEGSIFNIVTSISPKDDVNAGKSYYMAEVEGILRIIEALKKDVPVFCVIDEIFRGTNPVERVAASAAILEYINKYNAITFVATHDRELTDMLKDKYEFRYFAENVDRKKGMTFDYKMKKGISKTRNAIKVLEYVGYPKEITDYSKEYAKELDKIS